MEKTNRKSLKETAIALSAAVVLTTGATALPMAAAQAEAPGVQLAASDTTNPCNPCNPCAAACNPCNPCAAACNPCNPCAAACNPCNPCAAACNPCNPCAATTN